MDKDLKAISESNERMIAETDSWRQDFNTMAMVQSCTAEFIQMQTAIDQENLQVRSKLLELIENLKIYDRRKVEDNDMTTGPSEANLHSTA